MPIPSAPDPNATCPHCGRSGMVGHDREFVGTKATTIFKCHNCNHTWRVPDAPT
jgi:DNA-directed RNA polymerase subunit M/transcription elongation factor TFIIS